MHEEILRFAQDDVVRAKLRVEVALQCDFNPATP